MEDAHGVDGVEVDEDGVGADELAGDAPRAELAGGVAGARRPRRPDKPVGVEEVAPGHAPRLGVDDALASRVARVQVHARHGRGPRHRRRRLPPAQRHRDRRRRRRQETPPRRGRALRLPGNPDPRGGPGMDPKASPRAHVRGHRRRNAQSRNAGSRRRHVNDQSMKPGGQLNQSIRAPAPLRPYRSTGLAIPQSDGSPPRAPP